MRGSMPVTIILRVRCDAFGQKIGNLRRKCLENSEFEGPNVRDAKITAEEAGWAFSLRGSKDFILCPKCGPIHRSYLYSKK